MADRAEASAAWETRCPEREDQQHCNHWYDDEPCCACGDDGMLAASPDATDLDATREVEGV